MIKHYADAMIDNMFEHNILLNENTRLDTEEDEQKLNNIKNNIFVHTNN